MLKRSEFVTRIMNLIGETFPHLEGPDLSFGEMNDFRLKLGKVIQQSREDACQHEQPELSVFGPGHYCALCGAVLPPKEMK